MPLLLPGSYEGLFKRVCPFSYNLCPHPNRRKFRISKGDENGPHLELTNYFYLNSLFYPAVRRFYTQLIIPWKNLLKIQEINFIEYF